MKSQSFFTPSKEKESQSFDSKEHEKILRVGGKHDTQMEIRKDEPGKTYVWLEDVYTHSGAKGRGYGTAVMREAIKKSLDKCEGRFRLDGASSLLFHLKMGMMPRERLVNYIEHRYGIIGVNALKNKASPTASQLKTLIEIIKEEAPEIPNPDSLTRTDIWKLFNGNEKLAKLSSKKVSYLREIFIPDLLQFLKANMGVKFPETPEAFGGVQMELSSSGLERWRETIEKDKVFVPFRQFEHLDPFMTPEQRKTLGEINESIAKAAQKSTETKTTPENESDVEKPKLER